MSGRIPDIRESLTLGYARKCKQARNPRAPGDRADQSQTATMSEGPGAHDTQQGDGDADRPEISAPGYHRGENLEESTELDLSVGQIRVYLFLLQPDNIETLIRAEFKPIA